MQTICGILNLRALGSTRRTENFLAIDKLAVLGALGSLPTHPVMMILIIIGNVLGLRGLNLLYGRGDGIRKFTTVLHCYMGRTLSAQLLNPSPLLKFISLTGKGMELEPSPLNGTRSAPAQHLRLSVSGVE